MDIMEIIYTAIIALITVLGSAGAWRYYEKQSEMKRDDDNFIKNDCRERISKLETLLEKSSTAKHVLIENLVELTKQVAELRIKVEFLEKENRLLLERNANK